MNGILRVFFGGLIFTSSTGCAVDFSVDMALHNLEQKNVVVTGWDDLNRCADRIRGTEDDVSERLLAITICEDVDWKARAISLQLAAERCEGCKENWKSFVTSIEVLLKQAQEETKEGSFARVVFDHFLQNSVQTLVARKQVDADLAEHLCELANQRWLSVNNAYACVNAIATATATQKEMDKLILSLLKNNRCSIDLFDRLSVDAIPDLRAELLNCAENGIVNMCIVRAAVYMGDEELLKILPKLPSKIPGTGHAFSSEPFIQLSKLQNPPQRLLQYLESGATLRIDEDYIWAMHRAFTIGLSRESVRKALLMTADRLKDESALGKESLYRLKREGCKLGFLRLNDLPDIPVPH